MCPHIGELHQDVLRGGQLGICPGVTPQAAPGSFGMRQPFAQQEIIREGIGS
jgi:hypothetical protein